MTITCRRCGHNGQSHLVSDFLSTLLCVEECLESVEEVMELKVEQRTVLKFLVSMGVMLIQCW